MSMPKPVHGRTFSALAALLVGLTFALTSWFAPPSTPPSAPAGSASAVVDVNNPYYAGMYLLSNGGKPFNKDQLEAIAELNNTAVNPQKTEAATIATGLALRTAHNVGLTAQPSVLATPLTDHPNRLLAALVALVAMFAAAWLLFSPTQPSKVWRVFAAFLLGLIGWFVACSVLHTTGGVTSAAAGGVAAVAVSAVSAVSSRKVMVVLLAAAVGMYASGVYLHVLLIVATAAVTITAALVGLCFPAVQRAPRGPKKVSKRSGNPAKRAQSTPEVFQPTRHSKGWFVRLGAAALLGGLACVAAVGAGWFTLFAPYGQVWSNVGSAPPAPAPQGLAAGITAPVITYSPADVSQSTQMLLTSTPGLTGAILVGGNTDNVGTWTVGAASTTTAPTSSSARQVVSNLKAELAVNKVYVGGQTATVSDVSAQVVKNVGIVAALSAAVALLVTFIRRRKVSPASVVVALPATCTATLLALFSTYAATLLFGVSAPAPADLLAVCAFAAVVGVAVSNKLLLGVVGAGLAVSVLCLFGAASAAWIGVSSTIAVFFAAAAATLLKKVAHVAAGTVPENI